MKKFKFLAILAAGAMVLGGGLASCTPSDNPDPNPNPNPNPDPEGKTINLVLSGPADKADLDAELIEDFKEYRKSLGDPNTYVITQEAHGEDKVDSEVVDWSNGPDVYAFGADKTQGLFKKGALGELKGTYADYVKENNSATGIQGATFNGSTYAFPYTADNTYYLMYDKSVFTEEDVSSIEGILAKCEEANVNFAYNLSEGFYSLGAMFTFGCDYDISFSEDGQITNVEADFNNENGMKAIKLLGEITSNPHWIDTYTVAGTENVKIAVNGTWDIATVQGLLGDNYGCAPMPTATIDGTTAPIGNFIGAKLLGVNPQRAGSDTDRLTAAYNLAQYLSGPEAQLKRFQQFNIGPCNLEVAASEEIQNNENMKVLMEQNTWGHAQTIVTDPMWQAAKTLVTGLIDGTVTDENYQEALDILNNVFLETE